MFGTLRTIAAKAKAAFAKVRSIAAQPVVTLRYTGPAIPVVTRRQRMALRLAAATCRTNPHRHGYIPPSFEFDHVTGQRDRSQKQRSNRRKASAKAHQR